MNIKLLFIIFLVVVVSACSAHKKIYPDSNYVLDKNSGKSVAVMSYRVSGLHDVPFSLLYRRAPSKRLLNIGELSLAGAGHSHHQGVHFGKHDDQVGNKHLYVFDLPTGQYEFYGMFIEDGYEQADWSIFTDFSIPFEVTPGKVTYIGSIDIQTKAIGNNDYVVESTLLRTDMSGEDIITLAKQFPNVGKNDVFVSKLAQGKDSPIIRTHYGKEQSLGNRTRP